MRFTSAIFLSTLFLAVSAQTAAQNASAAALAAQIPACALPCDQAAILSVGCGLTEYSCHCAHGSQLAVLIPPCLEKNATCTPTELQSKRCF
jgi:CFEM domain